jgi:hypothetical protein
MKEALTLKIMRPRKRAVALSIGNAVVGAWAAELTCVTNFEMPCVNASLSALSGDSA